MFEKSEFSFWKSGKEVLLGNRNKYTMLGLSIMAVHILYAVTFICVKIVPMAVLSILSVLFYLYFTFAIVRKNQYFLIYLSAVLEVSLYSAISTILLGQVWGFMFYTVALVPVVFYLAYTLPGLEKYRWLPEISTAGVAVLYIGIDLYSDTHAPIYAENISGKLVRFFHYFDIGIAFLLLLLFSWLFAYEVQRMQNDLQRENRHLEKISRIDPLTLLLNRRGCDMYFKSWMLRAESEGMIFSVVMADVDDFKQINDKYGHMEGDNVLRMISKTIRNNIRESDMAFRWGGEEFLILLCADKEKTIETAFRIRKEIEVSKIRIGEDDVHVTATMGIATYQKGVTAQDLIRQADEKMYEGKMNGKNGVFF